MKVLKRGNLKCVTHPVFSTMGRVQNKNGGKCDLFRTRVGEGRRSLYLGDFFAAQKTFVSLKKAPKQTLCSLPTSDMLDITSNTHIKDQLYYLPYLSS